MTNITDSITNNIIATIRAERTGTRSTSRAGKPVKGFKTRATADGTPIYEAQIGIDGRKVYLGSFLTPEEASAAYTTAKARIAELRQQPQ